MLTALTLPVMNIPFLALCCFLHNTGDEPTFLRSRLFLSLGRFGHFLVLEKDYRSFPVFSGGCSDDLPLSGRLMDRYQGHTDGLGVVT